MGILVRQNFLLEKIVQKKWMENILKVRLHEHFKT